MAQGSTVKPAAKLAMVNLQYPKSLTSVSLRQAGAAPPVGGAQEQPGSDPAHARYVSPYETSLVRAYTSHLTLESPSPGGGGGSGAGGGRLFMNALSGARTLTSCWGAQPVSAAIAAIYGRPVSKRSASRPRRDSEDLVATGTNPLQPQAGFGRRPVSLSQVNGLQSSQSSGALSQMGSQMSRKLPNKPNVFGPSGSIRSKDLTDPKYADPLQGAPPTFQQRLAEINSLEQETLRYERAKKFKKKTKSET